MGYRLAQGQTLEEILANLEGTAEGVNTTKVVVKIADSGAIAVPIAQQVNKLLQGEISPQSAIKALMERNLKLEFDDLNL